MREIDDGGWCGGRDEEKKRGERGDRVKESRGDRRAECGGGEEERGRERTSQEAAAAGDWRASDWRP